MALSASTPVSGHWLRRPAKSAQGQQQTIRMLWRVSPRFRAQLLAEGETPPRSANPATLLGNVLIAIEARDLLPASLGEGFGQRTLGCLVAVSSTGKDRSPRNPIS